MWILDAPRIKLLRPDVMLPAVFVAVALFFMSVFENGISVYRPIISIELIFVAALISLRRFVNALTNFVFITMFFAVFSFQLIELVSVGFNMSILDIYFSLMHSAAGMPITARYALVLFIILWIAAFFFERKIPSVNIKKRFFLLLFLTPISFDVVFGANRLYAKDVVKFPNIISAPIINRLYNNDVESKFEYWLNVPESHTLLLDSIKEHNYVLFVEFESLGYAVGHSDNEFIDSMIQKTFKKYELVNKFPEKFSGGTLAGELRTLCGIKAYGDLIRKPETREGELLRCIPNLLHGNNNKPPLSIAVHANFGSFYNREKIYPAMGFDRVILASDLNNTSGLNCDNVQFIKCDDEALDKLKEVLADERREKKFIHFMTINSHFPYSGKVVENIDSNDILTAYYAAIHSTLNALENFIDDSKVIPDVIVISGDHAPPFTSSKNKSKFSNDVVPVYVFKIFRK